MWHLTLAETFFLPSIEKFLFMESIRTNLSMPLALSLERLNALILPLLLSEWNDLRIERKCQST